MNNGLVNQVCITDLTPEQIHELVAGLGESEYRARQLLRWLYQEFASSYDEMTDLPKTLRQKLARETRLHSLVPVREVVSSDGTVKTLFTLADGRTIESALMYYPAAVGRERYTVCLSTQVGCAIGCPFCATGQQGFERNLTQGEMIDQVLYFSRQLKDQDKDSHITNIVFMGMGEPLANYDTLWSALAMITSPEGLGLGARHITISTAGLVPQIRRLSQEPLQVGLAVSLHASENALRNKLVPLNKKYPLEQLIPECREYFRKTGRRPSFEYILFAGVNDTIEQARSLARLLAKLNCHVNLIPANPSNNKAYTTPLPKAVLAFEKELTQLHIKCTLRAGMGVDIEAGCGQLRSRFGKGKRG
jgi:23S rRNA (adenine2503-C2)-methyltransferase